MQEEEILISMIEDVEALRSCSSPRVENHRDLYALYLDCIFNLLTLVGAVRLGKKIIKTYGNLLFFNFEIPLGYDLL
jgi:hypothetical protein